MNHNPFLKIAALSKNVNTSYSLPYRHTFKVVVFWKTKNKKKNQKPLQLNTGSTFPN